MPLNRLPVLVGTLSLLGCCLGACQSDKHESVKPETATVPAQAATGGSAVPATSSAGQGGGGMDGSAAERGPFQAASPPEAWAVWPMPNAQLPGLPNPQRYDTHDMSVVGDEVTGLMWQRSVANEFVTFDDAQRRCDQLKLAGFDDWRLPSRIELVSLLDMSRTQPSINVSTFPDAPSEWFWTSTVDAAHPGSAWFVYFYAGYPKTDEKSNRFEFRCVRDSAARVRPPAHYEVKAAVVRDLGTGLTWQRAASEKKITLDVARTTCSKLTLGGKKGWRLPTEGELFTLVDEKATEGPMIDAVAFPRTPAEQFWSSSFFANGPALSWYVAFDHGDGRYGFPTEKYHVRCVL